MSEELFFTIFTLDYVHFLTISYLTAQAPKLSSAKEVELLREIDMITEFETYLWGVLISLKGKVTFINELLKKKDN